MEQLLAGPKQQVVEQLRKEILAMQGFRRISHEDAIDTGLGPVEAAFPGKSFPFGAIHEFTSHAFSHVAATNGFMAGIISKLMHKAGTCLWVSTRRTLFPPALALFGIEPHRVIFINPGQTRHALWAIEEALKCASLAAVVGELRDLTFTQSRRLQLAVEQSHVTGFIHRIGPRSNNTIAAVSRWQIAPIATAAQDLPGLGHPRWHVRLANVRNGKPGNWNLEWSAGRFRPMEAPAAVPYVLAQQKTG